MYNRKQDITRIRHMLDFAGKVLDFTRERNREDLDSNEMMAMATIHLIELIGEASRPVSEAFKEKYPDIPWEAIAGTRNRLAHGYIDVDLDIIWAIVTGDLPDLVRQLEQLLDKEGSV
jgi:uncharacterized protein with HEPN domain